jgi:hypothetical protein
MASLMRTCKHETRDEYKEWMKECRNIRSNEKIKNEKTLLDYKHENLPGVEDDSEEEVNEEA